MSNDALLTGKNSIKPFSPSKVVARDWLKNRKPNIMVVDDDPLVLLAVGGMLKRLNCKIITADNGGKAVTETMKRSEMEGEESQSIDLIVMDANMPVMNGYDAAAKITSMKREGKLRSVDIVCLSAQESELHEELCRSSGMQYISTLFNTNGYL